MTYGLDSVAKWILEKCPEVVVVIVRPEAGRSIVFATVGEAGSMKRGDLGSRRCLETPVALCIEIGGGGLVYGQARVEVFNVVASHAEAKSVGAIIDLGNTKSRHYRVVERPSNFNAWDRNGNVVEH